MQGQQGTSTKPVHLIGDLILINLSFIIAYKMKFGNFGIVGDDKYFILLVIFNLAWFISTYVLQSYEIYRITKNENTVTNLLKLFAVHMLLIAGFFVFRKAYYYSREQLLFTYSILIILITLFRLGTLIFLRKYRERGYNFRRAIIVGLGEISCEIKQSLEEEQGYGFKLIGYFDDHKTDEFVTGKVTQVIEFCNQNDVKEIFCSVPDLTTQQIRELVEFADNNLIRIKIIPDVRGFLHKKLRIDFFEHIPVLLFRNIPLDGFHNKMAKRIFDIFFSLFVIIFIMSWLFPILAIAVKLSSKGPVFFKQKRSGINNEDFWCYKFRSMTMNSQADTAQATKNDARVTKVGKFLRKTSLDEFPQFFNVFIGNMSVVGPRPHMVKHTEEYSKHIDKYMVRHFIKPGITGLAQVKGYRGETKESFQMKNRIKFDVMYIENWSFILDIKIILLTVINIFKKEENAF